ncbi:hypothetical protein Hanom_Chr09g00762171 [Helianthus anomalus]
MQDFCLSLPRILRRYSFLLVMLSCLFSSGTVCCCTLIFVAFKDVGLSSNSLLLDSAASACAAAIAFRAFRCRIPHALQSDYKEKITTFELIISFNLQIFYVCRYDHLSPMFVHVQNIRMRQIVDKEFVSHQKKYN